MSKSRTITTAAIAVGLALLGMVPVGGQEPPADPQTVEDLLRVFGVDAQPTDFVVVVDTSGSMSEGPDPIYPAVQGAYAQLVAAMSPGDHLSLVTFDSDTEIRFDAVLTDDASRQSAIGALPPVADGNATDIGAGLAEALRRLERVDSAEVQVLLFLTDGLLSVPRGSSYGDVNGAAWQDLGTRGAGVAGSHSLRAFGVDLGRGQQTDIGLLRLAVPDPTIVALPADQLGPYFQDAVRQGQLARLIEPLTAELQNGRVEAVVTNSPTLANEMSFDVRLTSTYQHLPVDVSLQHVTATLRGTATDLEYPTEVIVLQPGESIELDLRGSFPNVTEPGFQVPQEQESAEVAITIDGTSVARPAELIERVFHLPNANVVASPTPAMANRTIGYTYIGVAARLLAALLAALAVLLFLRWLFIPPRLQGELELVPEAGAPGRKVELRGRRMDVGPRQFPQCGGGKIEVYTKARRTKSIYAREKAPEFEQLEGRQWKKVTGEVQLMTAQKYRIGGAIVRFWRTRAEARAQSRV